MRCNTKRALAALAGTGTAWMIAGLGIDFKLFGPGTVTALITIGFLLLVVSLTSYLD